MFNYGQAETQDHEPKRPVAVRMETLEAALAALHRRHTRSRLWLAVAVSAGACLGALGAVAIHGQAPAVVAPGRETPAVDAVAALPKEIELERLVIRDRRGEIRAVIGVDEEADERPVSLELRAKGKAIARLGGHGAGDVELIFPGERPDAINGRAWIGTASGDGAIGLADKLDRPRLRLYESKGDPTFSLVGPSGVEGFTLELNGVSPILDVINGHTGQRRRVLDSGVLVMHPKPE